MVVNNNYANPIPFSEFTTLITRLQKQKPRKVNAARSSTSTPPQDIFGEWVDELKEKYDPLPSGTGTIVFRLLFPDHGMRRRYGMKEEKLSQFLVTYFRTKKGAFEEWCLRPRNVQQRTTSKGSLGAEVVDILGPRYTPRHPSPVLTLGRADELLDYMASRCQFSSSEVLALRSTGPYQNLKPTKANSELLKDLLDPLSAVEIAIMVQIILCDLSPLIYAPPSLSGIIALRDYNSAAYQKLELWQAIKKWHPSFERLFRITASLDVVTRELEAPCWSNVARSPRVLVPQIGIPIQIPKSERPGTCARAASYFTGSVAAETKYDGERLQVHVDMTLTRDKQIQIFSKSMKDSTEDRIRLQSIIRASLDLDFIAYDDDTLNSQLASRVPRVNNPSHSQIQLLQLIIEGEMVPFNEETGKIDEYWKLKAAKYATRPSEELEPLYSSDPESCDTGATRSPCQLMKPWVDHTASLHLMTVWFDLLYINGQSLLDCPFEERRERLVNIVTPIYGFSMLAHHVIIDFDQASAVRELRLAMASIIARREEGLMLKKVSSKYNQNTKGNRWVKLKKDFIPGTGDTKDFWVVGASWDKERGRALGVPTSVLTTFFVGCLADELGPKSRNARTPHYHILFTCSYGLNRDQIDELNATIENRAPLSFNPDNKLYSQFRCSTDVKNAPKTTFPVYSSPATSFTFSLTKGLTTKANRPWFIFKEPMVFEMMGAGYQKAVDSRYYELRWPRITKVDRKDGDALTLVSLQREAERAMKDHDYEPAAAMAFIWGGHHAVGGGKSETAAEKLRSETLQWIRKLEAADKVPEVNRTTSLSVADVVERQPPLERPLARSHAFVSVGNMESIPTVLNYSTPKAREATSSIPRSSPTPKPVPRRQIHEERNPVASTSKIPIPSPFSKSGQNDRSRLPSSSPRRRLRDTTSPSSSSHSNAATNAVLPRSPERPALPSSLSRTRKRRSEPSDKTEQLPTPPISSELDLVGTPRPRKRRKSAPESTTTAPNLPPPRGSLVVQQEDQSIQDIIPDHDDSGMIWGVGCTPCEGPPHSTSRRHADLGRKNFSSDPVEVFRAAGWEVDGHPLAEKRDLKVGWVFVEAEQDVERLRRMGMRKTDVCKPVFLLPIEALDKVGALNVLDYVWEVW